MIILHKLSDKLFQLLTDSESALNMEEMCSSETSKFTYQTITRHYKQELHNRFFRAVYLNLCENADW
jgi:hypothetical protein